MAETNNSTTEYVKTLREQAMRLDNDKYLLKIADAVEQNKGVLSAVIELTVASRIQSYNTNQLISEQFANVNELITGLIQYQQRCTDLAIAAFGIPEGAVNQEEAQPEQPAEPKLQLEDPVEEPVQTQPVQAPAETPAPAPEPEPQVKVPDAPKPAKTGKVPDFKVS